MAITDFSKMEKKRIEVVKTWPESYKIATTFILILQTNNKVTEIGSPSTKATIINKRNKRY